MTTAAIIQSSFLPWKGYFDIIHDCDIFVFLDDVQFTRRDWRTRNFIKTPRGIEYINIPVHGGRDLLINQIEIDNSRNWQNDLLRTFELNYARAQHFSKFRYLISSLFAGQRWKKLSDFNQTAIKLISETLGIKTRFIDSRSLNLKGKKTDRLIDVLKKIHADVYISGPAARIYINEDKFKKAKVQLKYKDYSFYPEYNQLWGKFEHNVTILDLLFNTGGNAANHIWKQRQ